MNWDWGVVFHDRLKGEGYGGNGKGGNGGNGCVLIPGEWTCPTCLAPQCWATKHSCYRCGNPWDGMTGGNGQGGRGAGQAKGGEAQGGVGAAMSGMRVIGKNGRDQAFFSGW